jgi:hypothetical protein
VSVKATFAALGVALGVVLGAAGNVAASAATGPLDDFVEVGSGEMRWFGMEIYDARLLNGSGRFVDVGVDGPMALEITYRRSIPRDRLVKTTEREWNRLERELGLPERATVREWLQQLTVIWPDVSPGDRILAISEPGGATRFYGNAGFLGTIDDPAFGAAFLGIWLHPNTRAADLRTALIGEIR